MPLYAVSIMLPVFFVIYAFFCGGIKKPVKKILYLMPYFVSVFILQAIAYRGEVYRFLIFNIDKKGAELTVVYFIRFACIIFFLALVMLIAKKIKIPKNAFGKEMLRVIIFFKLIRKYFFKELNNTRQSKEPFIKKIKMIRSLIINLYKDVFEKYPFDKYLLRFIK